MKRELSEITKARYARVLKSYFDADREKLRPYSSLAQSSRVILAAALRHAGYKELAESIVYAQRSRKDLEIPDEEDLKRLELAMGEVLEEAEGHVALFTLKVGLRSFEVLNLTRKQVEAAAKTGILRVRRKNDYEANVGVGPSARNHLATLLTLPRKGRGTAAWDTLAQAISTKGTFTAGYSALRSCVRKASIAAGLAAKSPHWLRHAFATRMSRRGASVTQVQKQLGHVNGATTLRYLHANMDEVLKLVE